MVRNKSTGEISEAAEPDKNIWNRRPYTHYYNATFGSFITSSKYNQGKNYLYRDWKIDSAGELREELELVRVPRVSAIVNRGRVVVISRGSE